MQAKPLGELLRFITRHWSPKEFPSGEFQYIEISGVSKEDGIIASHPVNIEKAPSRATTLVKTGDILISTTRPYLGSHVHVPQKYDGCVCSSGFALADRVASDTIDPDYVVFFLKSAPGLRQMERRMTGGLYPAIVQAELEKVMIPMPPISIQREAMKEAETFRARIAREREAAQKTAQGIESDLEAWLLGTKKI